MRRELKIEDPWVYFSWVLIIIFGLLQLLRSVILPQFMDIYYHLQVAWGFVRSGGYSGWDFWEYAPFGRPHIYPPFFHIILALLMKLGFSAIFLAKLFESAAPVLFLIAIWYFIKKNYSAQLAFFVVLAFSSAFAFFISLSNHVPAALALIFGLFSFNELFKNRCLRATILLALCFYTHIGVSWFFLLAFIFYGLTDKGLRLQALKAVFFALAAAAPLLIKQLQALPLLQAAGLDMQEKFLCQIKLIEYPLSILGVFFALKLSGRYRFFVSLFASSLVFLSYPYRFFSAEGYLPVIFLSALAIQAIWNKLKACAPLTRRLSCGLLIIFFLFVSPTLSLNKPGPSGKISYELKWMDSAFCGMLFAKGSTIWLPREYASAVEAIRNNSSDKEIIYSNLNIVGPILGSLAQRATANALLPEIGPARTVPVLEAAGIIVLTRDLDEAAVKGLSAKYGWVKTGENKIFQVFKNPAAKYTVMVNKPAVSFPMIILIFILAAGLFWAPELAGKFKRKT
ncbi:MAG: hypothetical protein WC561_04385 [Candidatus Omnitrophota bacterium]